MLTVVIGLALLAFIIGGIDFNSISGNSRTVVAEVDGTDVKIQDYEALIDEMTTFYKYEMGQSSLDENTTMQIRSSVWNMWVSSRLIEDQCEKLGITVSDDELADNLSAVTPHPVLSRIRMFVNPETGRFDANMVVEFASLISSGNATPDLYKYWSYVQRNVRNQILQDKYYALVGASFNFNADDLSDFYSLKQAYDINYLAIPYTQVPDSAVTVSDSEVKSLYNKQKKSLARTQEERNVGIMSIDIRPSEQDFAEAAKWADKTWKEFSEAEDYVAVCNQQSDAPYDGIARSRADIDPDLAEFAFSAKAGEALAPKLYGGDTYKMARLVETGISAPDSVKVRHILVMESSDARTREVADSLLKEVNGGADFAALATKHSKAGTAQMGGELGWLKDGDLDKNFSRSCFEATVGRAYLYPMGQTIQLIQVTEATKPVNKVKLCALVREVTPSSMTYNSLYNDASQYAARYSDSKAFADSARTLSGAFYRSFDLRSDMNEAAGIRDSRQVVRWAFQAEEGDVTDKVFECGDKFVLASLNQIKKKGTPSLDEVSPSLRAELLKEKKAAKIIADNEAKLAGTSDLTKLGTAQTAAGVAASSRYIPGIGVEPAVSGSLKSLSESGEARFFEGATNVFAVKASVVNPQPESYDSAAIRSELSASRPYGQMVTQSLREGAEITDNRINFY